MKIKHFYIVFFLLMPAFLFAYLDPGTGSLLLYAVVGVISSVIFALRNLWYKLIECFFLHQGQTVQKNVLPDIVFYSEGGKYWPVFQPVIAALLKRNMRCGYVTCDKDDPGLHFQTENNCYTAFHPGGEMITISFLNNITTKLVVSTTPGLDVYMWKRSKNVKRYVHLFHSPTGVDFYEKYALSFYDDILTVGPFHEPAQKKLDFYRGLPHKRYYSTGCTYYDYLLRENKDKIQTTEYDTDTLLYAPSWGKRSSITKYQDEIIEVLLKTNMKVIFRPHPQSFISDKKLITFIKDKYKEHPRFVFDTHQTGNVSMSAAAILITDLSGILFDFAYLYTRPIIIINYDAEKGSYEAEDLGDSEYDVNAALQLAKKVDTMTQLTDAVLSAKNDTACVEKMKQFRTANIYHFGCAGEVAADNIISILKETE